MIAAGSTRPSPTASLLLVCGSALFVGLTVASSTLDAGWTPVAGLLPATSLAAGLLAAALALSRRTPELGWTSGFGLASAPGAAAAALALELRLSPGTTVSGADEAVAFTLFTAVWASSFLLAWWGLRARSPLPGLIPAGVLLAANVLNRPDHQTPYAFAFLGGVIVLLLASNHFRLHEAAALLPAQGSLTTGRLWSAGALLGTAALLVAALLPPASSEDLTASWHPAWPALDRFFSSGAGGGGGAASPIGFSTSAGLNGPLTEGTPVTVFTYAPVATASGAPLYFRALNLPEAASGGWTGSAGRRGVAVPAGAAIGAAEASPSAETATVDVSFVRPISSPPGLLVYPGELVSADRPVFAAQQAGGQSQLLTVDRVQSQVQGGSYSVQVALPAATESELRAAGTAYPDWVQPYRGGASSYTLPGYRDPAVLARTAALARQLTAGATNPYDQANLIQGYLRSSPFSYTLTPPPVPSGTDPLAYFLFQSHQGFCQYYAVAMGDLLRSLGIPTRLVNGFGPGKLDSATGRYSVTTADAHTWVEAYFPGYGWIPFEPTPDGVYSPIPRAPEVAASTPAQAPAAAPAPAAGAAPASPLAAAGRSVARAASRPLSGLLLLLALLALVLGLGRLAKPRSVASIWRRLRWLSARAGLRPERAETPLELATRLAARFPDLKEQILRLGEDVTTACYSSRSPAQRVLRPSVQASWRSVQPVLVRAAAGRLLGRGR